MKKLKNILMVFVLFMFLFIFIGVNNASANSINNNPVFKKIKEINLTKTKSIFNKEKEIKSIMDKANVNDLKIYNKWKNNEIDKSINLLNKKINKDQFVSGTKSYSSILDDGTVIKVTLQDEAVNEDGSTKVEPQTDIWKNYGSRRYTFTMYLPTSTLKLISGYTISAKGLTTRYVKTSFSSIAVGIDIISEKWEKKTAVKIGDKINTMARWKVTFGPFINDMAQRGYMKIVKWDKAKKKILVGQTGSWKKN